jgi:putative RecB family exonuclease
MWASIGGIAYHACVREFEQDAFEMDPRCVGGDDEKWEARATTYADKFAKHFADATAEETLKSDVPMKDWYVNSAKEDRDWWLTNGPGMVHRYIMAQRNRECVLATVDGAPALEIEISINIDGVDVKGYIDRIMYYPETKQLIIEDDKTGARWPQDRIQLDTYAEWAILNADAFGVSVKSVWSRYWHARNGEHILSKEFNPGAAYALAYRYRQLDRADRAGIYPARPSNLCKACPVRSSCPVVESGNTDVFVDLTKAG